MKFLTSLIFPFQFIYIFGAGYVPNYQYTRISSRQGLVSPLIPGQLPQKVLLNVEPVSENLGPQKVDVAIFYESMCPSCRQTFKNILPKVVQALGPYINLQLYPYGFQEEVYDSCNGTVSYKCQHGPQECVGNKLHACALSVLRQPSVYMPFLSCLMSAPYGGQGSDSYTAQMCGGQLGIAETQYVLACLNSPQAQRLIKYIGAVTKQASLSEVPTALVNNRKVDESNLYAAICNALPYQPPECY